MFELTNQSIRCIQEGGALKRQELKQSVSDRGGIEVTQNENEHSICSISQGVKCSCKQFNLNANSATQCEWKQLFLLPPTVHLLCALYTSV